MKTLAAAASAPVERAPAPSRTGAGEPAMTGEPATRVSADTITETADSPPAGSMTAAGGTTKARGAAVGPAAGSKTEIKPSNGGTERIRLQDELPASFREAIPKVRLDVLVYSDAEADSMIFINSQKYLVGQTVEGKLLVERITEDGAILSYQGQRFLLKQ